MRGPQKPKLPPGQITTAELHKRVLGSEQSLAKAAAAHNDLCAGASKDGVNFKATAVLMLRHEAPERPTDGVPSGGAAAAPMLQQGLIVAAPSTDWCPRPSSSMINDYRSKNVKFVSLRSPAEVEAHFAAERESRSRPTLGAVTHDMVVRNAPAAPASPAPVGVALAAAAAAIPSSPAA